MCYTGYDAPPAFARPEALLLTRRSDDATPSEVGCKIKHIQANGKTFSAEQGKNQNKPAGFSKTRQVLSETKRA